jgi:hypothetical protein
MDPAHSTTGGNLSNYLYRYAISSESKVFGTIFLNTSSDVHISVHFLYVAYLKLFCSKTVFKLYLPTVTGTTKISVKSFTTLELFNNRHLTEEKL